MKLVLVVGCLAACTEHGSQGEPRECSPPDDGTALTPEAITVFSPCESTSLAELDVIDSEVGWAALFRCAQPVPAGIDFTTTRVAVVHSMCAQFNFRFASERSGEIVVGALLQPTGACIGNAVVVPLARSVKPVRLARCEPTCSGDCPPLPRHN